MWVIVIQCDYRHYTIAIQSFQFCYQAFFSQLPISSLTIFIFSNKGEAIAQAIMGALDRHGIPLANCIGQAYDGASNMSGRISGVAAVIKSQNPKAIYTHCKSHQLNLALMKPCQQTAAISKYINLIGLVTVVYTSSSYLCSIRLDLS